MTESHPRLTISGLVSAANRARAELAAGIAPEAAAEFRQTVTGVVARVEALCRQQQRTPAALPGPSLRAYRFLKSLDLDRLPRPNPAQAPAAGPPGGVRLRNVTRLAEQAQAGLARLAEAQASPSENSQTAGNEAAGRQLRLDDPATTLALRAAEHAATVEALCRERASTPAHLPVQSRRAYQWLKFLSDPARLRAVAASLAQARRVLAAATWPRRPSLANAAVHLEFYPHAFLYRMRPEARGAGAPVRVTLAPGYLNAPPDVLDALLRAALGYARQPVKARLHAYAASDDFVETTLAVELSTEPPPGSLRGRHYDLDQVFARVNHAYFGGQLARPRLLWSATFTRRMLGYYQHSSDRLMISQTLDDPAVPEHAIDMVMYHELLHKHLGVQIVNGRHYAHTEAFRQAEREFKEFAQAQAYLRGE